MKKCVRYCVAVQINAPKNRSVTRVRFSVYEKSDFSCRCVSIYLDVDELHFIDADPKTGTASENVRTTNFRIVSDVMTAEVRFRSKM